MPEEMRKVTLNYSTKNIPYPSEENYKRRLIEKTDRLVRNMRWRAFFHLNPDIAKDNKETYGFNSRNSPPPIEEMSRFENKLIDTIQNVEFNRHTNKLQRELKTDMDKLRKDSSMTIKADKTTNFYKMDTNEYKKLLDKNIQKTYKKTKDHQPHEINKEARTIAEELRLDDRIEITAQRESFITLKDHKPNFENNPTCRLINPAKSEIGRVSKKILEKIISTTTTATEVNLWKNTAAVIQWFNSIEKQSNATFISFDIIDFYPSISEDLLTKAIEFAAKFGNISTSDKDIIIHAKKAILYSGQQPWEKKDGQFDVTMGSYDGAESCEIVTTYILAQLKKILGNDVGMYRDDGLAVINKTPKETEKTKKMICKLFKNNGLKITINVNMRIVNFLDITLDIKNSKYYPYMKPNNKLLYVNAQSNHPPSVLKSIPKGINKRLSNISADEEAFNNAAPPYQEALTKSGFDHTLKYEQPTTNEKKSRSRKRTITWYNPPFDARLKTSLGKQFLKTIDDCFPPGHKLRKIFNRNTLKLSYSCMPNIKTTIDGNNKKKLDNSNKENENDECNCRKKRECPLDGKCNVKEVVYQATVETEKSKETYVGLTETKFKIRLSNHKQSFKKRSLENTTELSKHIWRLKDKNENYTLTWTILGKARAYSNSTKRCNLCLLEKYYIIYRKGMATLNKRLEILGSCRHSRKFLLNSVK